METGGGRYGKIAVCDDEKNIRSYLVSLIKRHNTECSIMEYASADEYLADGREHDLIFLDIEMGGSETRLDGMGLARHIQGMNACRQPIIIFVNHAGVPRLSSQSCHGFRHKR